MTTSCSHWQIFRLYWITQWPSHKAQQTGQTTHLRWQKIVTHRSIRLYKCSHRLQYIITMLHFDFRGSSMCYTCIIGFTGSLVESSNPVQQSSPPIQSTRPTKSSLCGLSRLEISTKRFQGAQNHAHNYLKILTVHWFTKWILLTTAPP